MNILKIIPCAFILLIGMAQVVSKFVAAIWDSVFDMMIEVDK